MIGFTWAQPALRWYCNALFLELGDRALDTDMPNRTRGPPWWDPSALCEQKRTVRAVLKEPLLLEIRLALALANSSRVHCWHSHRHTSMMVMHHDTTLTHSGCVLKVVRDDHGPELQQLITGKLLVFGQPLPEILEHQHYRADLRGKNTG
jgi:hypothetical protein